MDTRFNRDNGYCVGSSLVQDCQLCVVTSTPTKCSSHDHFHTQLVRQAKSRTSDVILSEYFVQHIRTSFLNR